MKIKKHDWVYVVYQGGCPTAAFFHPGRAQRVVDDIEKAGRTASYVKVPFCGHLPEEVNGKEYPDAAV